MRGMCINLFERWKVRRETQKKKRKGSFKKEEKSREKKEKKSHAIVWNAIEAKSKEKKKDGESQNISYFLWLGGCVNAICHLFLFSTFFHSSSIMNYLNKKKGNPQETTDNMYKFHNSKRGLLLLSIEALGLQSRYIMVMLCYDSPSVDLASSSRILRPSAVNLGIPEEISFSK